MFQKSAVSCLLLRRLLGMSASGGDTLLPDMHFHRKALVVVRPGLIRQHILKRLVLSLHNLLQDSLAIIKELLVLEIRQNVF